MVAAAEAVCTIYAPDFVPTVSHRMIILNCFVMLPICAVLRAVISLSARISFILGQHF